MTFPQEFFARRYPIALKYLSSPYPTNSKLTRSELEYLSEMLSLHSPSKFDIQAQGSLRSVDPGRDISNEGLVSAGVYKAAADGA